MAELGAHGELDPDQAAFLAELRARRGRLDGLYGTLVLHRPLAEMMLEIGRFYRTAATLDDRLREAATLAVATETRCAYVWSKHEPTARAAGLAQPAIEALRGGRWDDPALAADERDAVAVARVALVLGSVPADLQERAIAGWSDEGLPVGLQIVARKHRDDEALRIGRAVERVRPWADRRPPL
ncbi:MAG: carboxymuconolactone decarboxylase family protein [Actinomycetota bacterium]